MPSVPGIIQSRIASAGAGPPVRRFQAASPSDADTASMPQRSSARDRIAVVTGSSSAMTARMGLADASQMPAQKCAIAARGVAFRTRCLCLSRAWCAEMLQGRRAAGVQERPGYAPDVVERQRLVPYLRGEGAKIADRRFVQRGLAGEQ